VSASTRIGLLVLAAFRELPTEGARLDLIIAAQHAECGAEERNNEHHHGKQHDEADDDSQHTPSVTHAPDCRVIR
jgi:hypothetical protein